MIIEYDHNPNITEEQRLKSLKESVQRALEEAMAKAASDVSGLTDIFVEKASPMYKLDTTATSGTDKDIYDALVALGWTDVIV